MEATLSLERIKAEERDGEWILSFCDENLKLGDEKDAEQMSCIIEQTTCIDVLELKGNTIGVGAGKRIAEALAKHPELKRALWSDMFTSRLKEEIPPVLRSLTDAMINSGTQLTELDLSDNAFGPVGAEGIEKFLKSPAAYSLEVLKLNNTGLGAGGKVIAKSMIQCFENAKKDGQNFRLKTFIAGRNRLENPGAIALAEAFKTLGSLEEITLYQDGINPEGIIAIAKSLKYNTNLKILNLSDNTFTKSGAAAIAKALPALKNIETLNFGSCLCRDQGALAIFNNLNPSRQPNLKEIDFSDNELTPDAITHILTELYGNFKLSSISLHTNNLGHQFEVLKKHWEKFREVDFGEESDDQDTLEEDQEEDKDEILSNPSSSICSDDEQAYDSQDRFVVKDQETAGFFDRQLENDAENTVKAKTLDLSSVRLSLKMSETIARSVAMNPEITRLVLSGTLRTCNRSEIAQILGGIVKATVSSDAKIIELDLSSNALGPYGIKTITDFLKSASAASLQILKLSNNDFGHDGKEIAFALKQSRISAKQQKESSCLRVFEFASNRQDDSCAESWAGTFECFDTIEELDVSRNEFTEKGIVKIVSSFASNKNLKKIDLSGNNMGSAGAEKLAATLPTLTKLVSLSLGSCLCGDDGIYMIVSHLNFSSHFQLEHLDLSGNGLSENAVKNMARVFASGGYNLKRLLLHSNNIGQNFNELKKELSSYRYVELGPESQDRGMPHNHFKAITKRERQSGNEADDEWTEGADGDKLLNSTSVQQCQFAEADVELFARNPSIAVMEVVLQRSSAFLKILDKDIMGRTQELSSKLLEALCILMANEGLRNEHVHNNIISMAEMIVKAAERSRRQPLSATVQICNQLLACVLKNHERLSANSPISPTGVIAVLKVLIERGYFKEQIATVSFFFSRFIKETYPSCSNEIDDFVRSLDDRLYKSSLEMLSSNERVPVAY